VAPHRYRPLGQLRCLVPLKKVPDTFFSLACRKDLTLSSKKTILVLKVQKVRNVQKALYANNLPKKSGAKRTES